MRSTLFFIPHELFSVPIFGIGWALLLLAIAIGIFGATIAKNADAKKRITESAPVWLMLAFGIVFIVPRIEETLTFSSGEKVVLGLPIRGYGVMLLLGSLSGFLLTYSRARHFGFSIDKLLSLAFWAFIGGIGGARLFYVIQKWSEFGGPSLADKLWQSVQFTEGGLVVYGGIIGGLVSGMLWCVWKKVPVLALADLIVPGFMVGLAFGRIGCFLHGCCFGGVCQTDLPSVQFPSGSPAYVQQLETGTLIGAGIEYSNQSYAIVKTVEANSLAAQNGLKPGDRISEFSPIQAPPNPGQSASSAKTTLRIRSNGTNKTIDSLPLYSLPVHPAQIYSSVNAAILAGLFFFLWPFPRRDGVVFAIALVLYGISRIFEEIIRSDELGQFGTTLTISQWISLAGMAFGVLIIAVQVYRAKPRSWQPVRQKSIGSSAP
jgi:phosphatidylglycerol:prolipoprotein diacylglycerol transferase